jgi:hypothetical protein
MARFAIRPITPDDETNVLRFTNELGDERVMLVDASFFRYLTESPVTFLATTSRGDRIIGVIYSRPTLVVAGDTEVRIGYTTGLAIDHRLRRMGLAGELIKHVMAKGAEIGVPRGFHLSPFATGKNSITLRAMARAVDIEGAASDGYYFDRLPALEPIAYSVDQLAEAESIFDRYLDRHQFAQPPSLYPVMRLVTVRDGYFYYFVRRVRCPDDDAKLRSRDDGADNDAELRSRDDGADNDAELRSWDDGEPRPRGKAESSTPSHGGNPESTTPADGPRQATPATYASLSHGRTRVISVGYVTQAVGNATNIARGADQLAKDLGVNVNYTYTQGCLTEAKMSRLGYRVVGPPLYLNFYQYPDEMTASEVSVNLY